MQTKKIKQHTPGPWFEGTGWIGAGEVKQGRVVARIDDYPYGDTEANAKLIAAAPEMAEELAIADALLLQLCAVSLKAEVKNHLPYGIEEQVTDYLQNHTGKVSAALQKAGLL